MPGKPHTAGPGCRADHLPLLRYLWSIAHIANDDIDRLCALPLRVRDFGINRDVLREGDRSTEICFVIDGLLSRYKLIAGGRRQNVALHFAGEILDLQSLYLDDPLDDAFGTLTPCRVAFVSHDVVRALIGAAPTIAALFMRRVFVEAAINREWIATVGRRTGYERIAHLLCEALVRMRAVGLVNSDVFELPLTQSELGESTGLSTVHVNRTYQQLRRAGLINTRGKVHSVSDWEGLKRAADFNPAYFHLREAGPFEASSEPGFQA